MITGGEGLYPRAFARKPLDAEVVWRPARLRFLKRGESLELRLEVALDNRRQQKVLDASRAEVGDSLATLARVEDR